MAHRLVWQSRYDDKVAIYERDDNDKKLKGDWRSDDIGNSIVVRGPKELRTYLVREWLTKLECRATLTNITDTTKPEKAEDVV